MAKRKAAQTATAESQAAAGHTDAELEAWAEEQRRLYKAGLLVKWQIERLERIPGWTWGVA